jgi:hypothetical protein
LALELLVVSFLNLLFLHGFSLFTLSFRVRNFRGGSSSQIQLGVTLTEDKYKASEDFDIITLLINLYFPRLLPAFNTFREILQESIVEDGKFKIGNRKFKEDLLRVAAEGEKLKSAIIDLARKRRFVLEH